MPSSSNSILIIDDDADFRGLVATVLKDKGLAIIEASCGREADNILKQINPVLCIVDYKLPEGDGVTWITRLRESGRKFPLVFVSKVWCDQKTFSWLRNILKVSLILQKPIVPELFSQQIESLLPAPLLQEIQNPALINEQQPINLITSEPIDKSSEKLLVQMNDLSIKLERENKLAGVKANYAMGLAQSWDELTTAISKAHEDRTNGFIVNEAKQIAHKLSGTAGSVGFIKIGKLASKIEDLLCNLDPSDTMQDIIWAEILRVLADGEIAVREGRRVSDAVTQGDLVALQMSKILLYGNKEEYKYLTNFQNTPVQIEVAEGQLSLLKQVRHQDFEAVIFDTAIDDKERIFRLALEIRLLPGYQNLPFGFICQDSAKLSPSELVFAGCSNLLIKPLQKAGIEQSCRILLSQTQIQKPRVLIVDDDEVLTKFVAATLGEEGIKTSILNNPIDIMNAVNDFKPDLILLDVIMPGLSGYDMCRMLRQDDQWHNVPIVFLTAKNDQEGRSAAYQAGANDFLAKPVLTPELIARVRAQLKENRLLNVLPTREQVDGSMNAQNFMIAANKLLAVAQEKNTPVSICLLSLDDFMDLSAIHSLSSAQAATSYLETLIHGRFRAEDLRGRLGEDTFILAFSGENQQTITESINKLLSEFSQKLFSSNSLGHFKAAFSAGIVEYPTDGETFKELHNLANQRLVNLRRQVMSASPRS